jgi:hypothetical protein
VIRFGKVISEIHIFSIFKNLIVISNLNDNLHLKEFSLCVHVDFTIGFHQQ